MSFLQEGNGIIGDKYLTGCSGRWKGSLGMNNIWFVSVLRLLNSPAMTLVASGSIVHPISLVTILLPWMPQRWHLLKAQGGGA
jgi:hypothetical protein